MDGSSTEVAGTRPSDLSSRARAVDVPSGVGSADLPADVVAGQAAYTRRTLAVYDTMLGVFNRLVWRCPTARLRNMYDNHVTSRHLDVGVGSGYFLDHAAWPDPSPSITLVDLNVTSLNTAATRIRRFRPLTARRNILDPMGDLPGAPFTSVGLNYLLHCLPGSIEDKAHRVLDGLTGVLAPESVVFGSTVLAAGPTTPRPARAVMAFYNQKGIFHNAQDHLDGLERALGAAFAEHRVERVGSVAVFVARAPRPVPASRLMR